MPRVNRVKSARKDRDKGRGPRQCGKCGVTLGVGSTYIWWKFYRGGRRVRCTAHACRPRPTDLSNAKYAAIQQAVEDFESGSTLEELTAHVEELADLIDEVAGEYQDAADAIEAGLGKDDMEEFSGALSDWAEAIRETVEEAQDALDLDEDDDTVDVDAIFEAAVDATQSALADFPDPPF